MTHFIATSQRRPNAAQAATIRRQLREIDSHLELVVASIKGAPPCWVEGPDYFGDIFHRADRQRAADVLHAVLNRGN